MNGHVDEDTLAAFVEGTLGDHLGVVVAEHLDACPHCASRADAIDPIAKALAAAPDVVFPAPLVRRVLDEAAHPPPEASGALLAAGSAMLLVAAGVLVASADASTLAGPAHAALTAVGLALRQGLPLLMESVLLLVAATAGLGWMLTRGQALPMGVRG